MRAIREGGDNVVDLFTLHFADTLEMMNVNHPWTSKEKARAQVKEFISFYHDFTVEDVALFMDMLKRGELAKHYNRPNVEWLFESLKMYAELKAIAKEGIERDKKRDHELDMMMAMDPQWEGQMKPPVRTMAEFQNGYNRINPLVRAEMQERDRERRNQGNIEI